jgi:hypothetical protein
MEVLPQDSTKTAQESKVKLTRKEEFREMNRSICPSILKMEHSMQMDLAIKPLQPQQHQPQLPQQTPQK